MKKVLIDSDICLDSITGRLPYQITANRIFEYIEEKTIIGIVSAESFTNIFYILRKLSTSQKAIRQIKNLRLLVEVGTIYDSTVDSALNSNWNDFEDALQHYCAVENNCDGIITRNISDFKESQIPVFTPILFIEEHFS